MPLQVQDRTEILGQNPGWFTQSGSAILLGLVFLILICAFLIKYPDTIGATATITTNALPIPLRARQSGYLEKLLLKENELVKAGDLIGIIKSTVKYSQAFTLSRNLANLKLQVAGQSLQHYSFPELDSLGNLSQHYNAVTLAVSQLNRHASNPVFKIRIRKLNVEVDRTSEYLRRARYQLSLAEKELVLSQKMYRRDSVLYTQKVIALDQFEESEKTYSSQVGQFATMESEIQIQIENLRALQLQIDEIRAQWQVEVRQFRLALNQAIEVAEAEFEQWEHSFILRSPMEGKLAFFRLLDEQQYINMGDELMVVIPEAKQIFAVCQASLAGAGKIKVGQEVQIRLDSFPYQEFGFIPGRVYSISEISRGDSYMVKVDLPEGLVSNYNRKLRFTQEMSGQALIITEDLRLIDRFFHQFNTLVKR